MREGEFRGKKAAWMRLFHMVRDQFPFCRMKEVTIVDGVAAAFKAVQYTFVFSREAETAESLLPDSFDRQWRRFMRFCQAMENGTADEVHFADGRPVRVSMQGPGVELGAWTAPGFAGKGGESRRRQFVAV